jgi:hypothetical protein
MPEWIEHLRLIPVVELEPHEFSSQQHDWGPEPEARERYWRDSLADRGIVGLQPLFPGSWHVPVAQLTDPKQLAVILSRVVPNWPTCFVEDSPGALSGGLACFDGERLLFTPTCCSDLRNRDGWQTALDTPCETWQMLWIGHPWLYYRHRGAHLEWTDLMEGEPDEAQWSLGVASLALALAEATRQLDLFAERIEKVIQPLGADRSMACLLAGR